MSINLSWIQNWNWYYISCLWYFWAIEFSCRRVYQRWSSGLEINNRSSGCSLVSFLPVHQDSPAASLFLLLELFLSESPDATLWGEYSPSRQPGPAPGSLSPPTLSISGPPLPPPPPPPPFTAAGVTTGGQASGALTLVSQGLNCQSALWYPPWLSWYSLSSRG